MRVLVGADVTVRSPAFVGADGETAAACDVAPTVSVLRFDGTSVTPAPAVVDVATGVYGVQLGSTVTADLDLLTVTWTGAVGRRVQRHVDQVELVGGFYAELADLRALPGLASIEKFPAVQLRAARDEFEAVADEYLGVAYVPRFAVVTLPAGRGVLPHGRIRRVTGYTTGYTAGFMAGVTLSAAGLVSVTGAGGRDTVVAYEHGYDTPPAALQRACREYVRSVLLQGQSGVSRDVVWSGQDGMTVRYSSPDMAAGRPTGYLEVDRLLNSLPSQRLPGMA